MRKQPKYVLWGESRFFSDGRAMQAPPQGTVPREKRLAYERFRSPDGKYLDHEPIQLTREGLQRGRRNFEIYCGACHGLTGTGESIPARKMALKPPPSLHDFRGRPPGFFYQVITEGFGMMPSYAAPIPAEQRWEIVAYVRALLLSQHAPLSAAPDDEQRRLLQETQP